MAQSMRISVVLALALQLAVASEHTVHDADAFARQTSSGRKLLARRHRYRDSERITLWANKVGPLHNTAETYMYYDLPFCRPPALQHKPETLGEIVDGNRLINTSYAVYFKQDLPEQKLCTIQLTHDELERLRKAMVDDYYFQFVLDDLPMWGFLGSKEHVVRSDGPRARYWLHTHYHFDLSFNGDAIVDVNVVTPEKRRVDITDDPKDGKALAVAMSYSVKWQPSTTPYEQRMDKYRKYQINPQHLEIHWFSIINSCVTVLLLTGFLATILMRVLRNDFVKYTRDDEEDAEETGWKLLHGDVFRFPKHLPLFCALIGTGAQLLTLSVAVFLLGLLGTFYPHNRGAIYTAMILLYAATACIAGYVAAGYYRQVEGKHWARNILLTCFIYAGPFFLTFSFNNTLAIMYETTAALPWQTIVILVLLWALVTIPLTIFGGIIGKNQRGDFYAPVRTSKYEREIPVLPFYRRTVPQMMMAGFLPFSAIYIELYYILVSAWGHKLYTPPYSVLFIMFVILILVTAFITVALTYFQLAAEDHRLPNKGTWHMLLLLNHDDRFRYPSMWWWRSFLCGGATGVFIYGYCIFFFLYRSDMKGFYQAAFFFGYMAMVCFGFFIMLGTVGWRASLMLVRHIYKSVKVA